MNQLRAGFMQACLCGTQTGLDIFSAPEYGGAKLIGNKTVKNIAAIKLRSVTCKSSAN